MNRKIFECNIRFFHTNKAAYNCLQFAYKALPLLMFIAYPALLIYAFFVQRENLIRMILVPFGVFVLVTALRLLINEKRPYEKYGKPSVFDKQTKGKSFPSRHTASTFIIAMVFLHVNTPLGIAALAVSVLIALSRICAGAHYVHDVLAGMAISIAAGIVFLS